MRTRKVKNTNPDLRIKRTPVTGEELDKYFSPDGTNKWAKLITDFLLDMCTAWPISKYEYKNLGQFISKNKSQYPGAVVKTRAGKYWLFRVNSPWYQSHFCKNNKSIAKESW